MRRRLSERERGVMIGELVKSYDAIDLYKKIPFKGYF
jgi:hypothetical protein